MLIGLVGSERDTRHFAQLLVARHGFVRHRFRAAVERLCGPVFGLSPDRMCGIARYSPLGNIGGLSPDQALCRVRSAFVSVDRSVWARAWRDTAPVLSHTVAEDVSDSAEARMISLAGGILIKINRDWPAVPVFDRVTLPEDLSAPEWAEEVDRVVRVARIRSDAALAAESERK